MYLTVYQSIWDKDGVVVLALVFKMSIVSILDLSGFVANFISSELSFGCLHHFPVVVDHVDWLHGFKHPLPGHPVFS